MHMISTVYELVEWTMKERELCYRGEHKNNNMYIIIICLNIIDYYRFSMGSMDVTDKNRIVYFPDLLIFTWKLWWSF